MVHFREINMSHPLVRRTYDYITEHNGWQLSTLELAKILGLPVSVKSTKSITCHIILQTLIKHGLIRMTEHGRSIKRYYITNAWPD